MAPLALQLRHIWFTQKQIGIILLNTANTMVFFTLNVLKCYNISQNTGKCILGWFLLRYPHTADLESSLGIISPLMNLYMFRKNHSGKAD